MEGLLRWGKTPIEFIGFGLAGIGMRFYRKRKKEEDFIEEKRTILNSFTMTFEKFIKYIDYTLLTLKVKCSDERLKKLLKEQTKLS